MLARGLQILLVFQKTGEPLGGSLCIWTSACVPPRSFSEPASNIAGIGPELLEFSVTVASDVDYMQQKRQQLSLDMVLCNGSSMMRLHCDANTVILTNSSCYPVRCLSHH